MADTPEHCPDCGKPLSDELGQYSEDLLTGTVTCPHCGAVIELHVEPEPAEPAPARESDSAQALDGFAAEQPADGAAGTPRDDGR